MTELEAFNCDSEFLLLQQWSLQGTQVVNKENNYCLSAGAQSCGRWSNCNKAQAQTRQNNMILNVFAEPCNTSNINQRWSLGPAPNSTIIDFVPLNVSAAKYAPANNTLASVASNNSQSVRHKCVFLASYLPFCLELDHRTLQYWEINHALSVGLPA